MPIHTLKLIARKTIARSTIELIFEKPEGFTFKPGQYGGFTLIKPQETDAGGNTRRFSLLNSPHDNYIAISTRIQDSAYKRVLNELPLGSEVKFAGPIGTFILHDDSSLPAVFIAGGIGITPFYSMICDAIYRKSPQSILLFYGNQSPNDAAYLTELQQLQHENANFKLIGVMAIAENEWQGEMGFISYQILKKYISDLNVPFYYVCGSPAMVTALQETLDELEIPKDKIKVEDFPGY